MMLLLPKFLAGYSGWYVDLFGYSNFFTATAACWARRCWCWCGWRRGWPRQAQRLNSRRPRPFT